MLKGKCPREYATIMAKGYVKGSMPKEVFSVGMYKGVCPREYVQGSMSKEGI